MTQVWSAWQYEPMTDSGQAESLATPECIVRGYTDADYRACRALWAALTEHHRRIYGDPSIGGDDPGAGFDDYLATPQRVGSWVAESHGTVVGLTGLFDRGTSGEVEPVVVNEAARDQGIGRRLISHVVDEAQARGYEYLVIRPVARNVAAVRRFHAAGFATLGGTSTSRWTWPRADMTGCRERACTVSTSITDRHAQQALLCRSGGC
jgi:GNAT superfamily N-acetyltransferase